MRQFITTACLAAALGTQNVSAIRIDPKEHAPAHSRENEEQKLRNVFLYGKDGKEDEGNQKENATPSDGNPNSIENLRHLVTAANAAHAVHGSEILEKGNAVLPATVISPDEKAHQLTVAKHNFDQKEGKLKEEEVCYTTGSRE